MTVFLPELTREEQALVYGITGGIPHYINKLDASVFGKGAKYHYYIFPKSGFTQELQELGAKGEVTLLALDDLYA